MLVVDENYSSKLYWNKRYASHLKYEWYYTFEDLAPLFEKLIDFNVFKGNILEIGCGDCPLAIGLEKIYTESTVYAIDYSYFVIEQLNNCKVENKSEIIYKKMDARKLSFNSKLNFDIIIEKGTIDAMLCDRKINNAYKNVFKIISEVVNVLKKNGCFIFISHIDPYSIEFNDLLQNSILPVLELKKEQLWSIEAHMISSEAKVKEKNNDKKNCNNIVCNCDDGNKLLLCSEINNNYKKNKNVFQDFADDETFKFKNKKNKLNNGETDDRFTRNLRSNNNSIEKYNNTNNNNDSNNSRNNSTSKNRLNNENNKNNNINYNNDNNKNNNNNSNTKNMNINNIINNNNNEKGTVYVITSKPRKETRNSKKNSTSVTFKINEYNDDDDDDE
jgi:SAM-dependent methyltransferase